MGGWPCPCMTLRTASILIAIIEIIGSAIGAVILGLSLGGLVALRSYQFQDHEPESTTMSTELDSDTSYILTVIFGVFCAVSILELIFGCVLLIGIRQEKSLLVKLWLFFKLLCLALGTILSITSVSLDQKADLALTIVGECFGILLGLYIIYVVYSYDKELNTQARRVESNVAVHNEVS